MELTSMEFWQAVGAILGLSGLALGTVITTLWGTKRIVIEAKGVKAALQANAATLYKAIDEGTDAIPGKIAELTPSPNDSGEMYSAMFKALFETWLHYTPPPQEINIAAPNNLEALTTANRAEIERMIASAAERREAQPNA